MDNRTNIPHKTTKQLAIELGIVRKRSAASLAGKGHNYKHTGQIFYYLVVIDFESTCWENQRNIPQEIIEFPAVLLNTSTGHIEDEFHHYVQPQEKPTLSEFCRQLTGITQHQVDDGIPINLCLSRFSHWLKKLVQEKNVSYNMAGSADSRRCTFVTWSDWDLGVCLEYESRRKQLRKLAPLSSWIDLRATYRKFYNRKPAGLNGALLDLGIVFEGRQHSGLDDARNTAKLAWKMICDGCLMTITKTLSPSGRQQVCVERSLPHPTTETAMTATAGSLTGKQIEQVDSKKSDSGYATAKPVVSVARPDSGHSVAKPVVSVVRPDRGHSAAKPVVSVVRPDSGHSAAKPVVSVVRPDIGHAVSRPVVRPDIGHAVIRPVVRPDIGHAVIRPVVKPAIGHAVIRPVVKPAIGHAVIRPVVRPDIGHAVIRPVVRPDSGHAVIWPVVMPHGGHAVLRPVVRPGSGHAVIRPVVKPESGQDVIRPVVKPDSGHAVIRPVVRPDSGHVVLRPVVRPDSGHAVIRPVVKPESGQDVIRPVVKPDSGHAVIRPVVGPVGGHAVVSPVVRPDIGHAVSRPVIRPDSGHAIIRPVIRPGRGLAVPKPVDSGYAAAKPSVPIVKLCGSKTMTQSVAMHPGCSIGLPSMRCGAVIRSGTCATQAEFQPRPVIGHVASTSAQLLCVSKNEHTSTHNYRGIQFTSLKTFNNNQTVSTYVSTNAYLTHSSPAASNTVVASSKAASNPQGGKQTMIKVYSPATGQRESSFGGTVATIAPRDITNLPTPETISCLVSKGAHTSTATAVDSTAHSIYYVESTPSPNDENAENGSKFKTSVITPQTGGAVMFKTPPLCKCGRRCKRNHVQSPGANVGRSFFCCPVRKRSPGSSHNKVGCGFFQWEAPTLKRRNSTSPASFSGGPATKSVRYSPSSCLVQPNFDTPEVRKSSRFNDDGRRLR